MILSRPYVDFIEPMVPKVRYENDSGLSSLD